MSNHTQAPRRMSLTLPGLSAVASAVRGRAVVGAHESHAAGLGKIAEIRRGQDDAEAGGIPRRHAQALGGPHHLDAPGHHQLR